MSPGLRERKHARTKQAIYDAAMRLFAERGFDETTVDQIADAAEVSRATFFNYFGSKDGVLRHFSRMLAERLVQVAEESKGEEAPLSRMRLFLSGWLEHIARHREEARQFYLNAFGSPAALLNQGPERKSLFALFVEMVEEGRASGEIRDDLPSKHLAGFVLSIYQSVVVSYLLAGESLDELVDSAWRFVLQGVQSASKGQVERRGEGEGEMP